MKFDELLQKIGEFGPYQKRIYVLVSLTSVLAGYQAMAPVFLLEMNDHRCKIPFYANDTYAVQSPYHQYLINLTVPVEVDSQGETAYSKCTLFNITNLSAEHFANYTQYKCNEWVYDTSVIETTAFSEFRMVCEHKIYRSHTNMIDFAGALCGSILFGTLGDRLGRKTTLISVFLVNCVSHVTMSLSINFVMYATFAFILGLTGRVMFMVAFVHALEIVGPSKRALAGIAMEFFWSAGLFILTGVAYLVRQWRHLTLTLGIPSILILSYRWLIPESPRWLILQGRKQEASQIIKHIANSNGVELDESILDEITLLDENKPTVRVWHLLKIPSVALRVAVVVFNWFALNMVYYGLSLNVGNMNGNIYLNFMLSSLMELVAYTLAFILLNKMGRKTLHCVSMILGGLSCLSTIFPVIFGSKSTEWTIIALAMVGKLGAAAAFATIYVFSAELFPTVIRQSALGTCTVFEGVAGMVAPYIADLGIHVKGPLEDALPLIVFGSLTITAGLMAFILPETRGRKLPETIDDVIVFGRPVPVHISHDGKQSYRDIPLDDSV